LRLLFIGGLRPRGAGFTRGLSDVGQQVSSPEWLAGSSRCARSAGCTLVDKGDLVDTRRRWRQPFTP
jgi:hypothetical protein